MSLPLRPALENITSVDRVLEDLLVRFIINCPPEDLASVERELFHFEEASWFYIDFVRIINPTLRALKIKSFAQNIIRLCPLVWKWDIKADEALQKFSKYKRSIPVRGAAIFNENLSKILLVKGTESDSWSFPRGKISKDEDDVACCIREVKEEIGFDITDHIDENQFIERNIQGKNYKIFLVSGVPENFSFKPLVRNEIDKIEWRDFKKMSKTIFKSTSKYYLVNSMIRPLSMWLRRQKQIKGDDQLKLYAEEQLKLLLGLTKDEQVDPGRDLLNMLHSAVQANDTNLDSPSHDHPHIAQSTELWPPAYPSSNTSAPVPPPGFPAPFPQHAPPLMGFQPFAPFQFTNGTLPYSNPHMMPLNMPSLPVPNMGPLPPPGAVLSTPDASSLSKPVIASKQEDSGNTSSSKLLLDLLHTKPTASNKMTNGLGSDYDSTTNSSSQQSTNSDTVRNPSITNVTDSLALLSILKGSNNKTFAENDSTTESKNEMRGNVVKQEVTYNTDRSTQREMQQKISALENKKNVAVQDNYITDTQSNMNGNKSEVEDESYENYEDSTDEAGGHSVSEDEDEDEDSDDGFGYEDFESESELEEEMKVENIQKEEEPAANSIGQDALKANRFQDGEVPHKDERTESAKSVEGTRIANDAAKPKPKFKLLKRGENLEDVLTDIDNRSSQRSYSIGTVSLVPETAAEKSEFDPLHTHSGILNERAFKNSEVLQPDVITPEKQTPEEELMSMLKKPHSNHVASQQPTNEPYSSGHLLSILRKMPPKNVEVYPPTQQQDPPMSAENNLDASSVLLGILKGPKGVNITSSTRSDIQ